MATLQERGRNWPLFAKDVKHLARTRSACVDRSRRVREVHVELRAHTAGLISTVLNLLAEIAPIQSGSQPSIRDKLSVHRPGTDSPVPLTIRSIGREVGDHRSRTRGLISGSCHGCVLL